MGITWDDAWERLNAVLGPSQVGPLQVSRLNPSPLPCDLQPCVTWNVLRVGQVLTLWKKHLLLLTSVWELHVTLMLFGEVMCPSLSLHPFPKSFERLRWDLCVTWVTDTNDAYMEILSSSGTVYLWTHYRQPLPVPFWPKLPTLPGANSFAATSPFQPCHGSYAWYHPCFLCPFATRWLSFLRWPTSIPQHITASTRAFPVHPWFPATDEYSQLPFYPRLCGCSNRSLSCFHQWIFKSIWSLHIIRCTTHPDSQ